MKNISFTLFCSLILFSCTKYIEFDGEEKKSKIVVNGIIFNNEVAKVHVSRSLNVLENGDLNVIDNAVVNLYDENNNFVENLLPTPIDPGYPVEDGFYYGYELLNSNTEYKIEVSAPSFESVSSTTQIPQYNLSQFSPVDTSTTIDTEEYSQPRTKFTFHLSDNGNETNYYGIKAFGINAMGDQIEIGQLSTDDVSVETRYGYEILFTDKFFNGESHDLSIDFSTIDYNFFSDSIGVYEGNYDSIRFEFNSYSRDLYLYKKSYHAYQNVIEFFSQPVQVYSNIENGLGVFGAVKEDDFVVNID